jgi:hypothetical protein
MSTSGGTWVNALLFVVLIALSVQIGLILLGGRRPAASDLRAAAGIWLLVAVPSVLQMPFPALLTALRRDPNLIRHHGQVWRVLTSLVVQDGGLVGTVFNLVILAVVVAVAVPVWGPGWAFGNFVLAHLVFNVAATFLSADVGAGNSGATFGLSASMAGLAVLAGLAGSARREPGVFWRAAGVLAVGVGLVGIADAHGIAVLGGLVIGALVASATGRAGNLWQTRGHHAPG